MVRQDEALKDLCHELMHSSDKVTRIYTDFLGNFYNSINIPFACPREQPGLGSGSRALLLYKWNSWVWERFCPWLEVFTGSLSALTGSYPSPTPDEVPRTNAV